MVARAPTPRFACRQPPGGAPPSSRPPLCAAARRAYAAGPPTQDVIRGAVRRDVVVVAPIVPGPPPRLDAAGPSAAAWLRRARHFAAVTALAGAPTAVLPLGRAAGGGGGDAPVALALFGQARSDQRLLAVAAKLLPIAQARRACGPRGQG
jgi:Asp-tRNA(Asn)/Glu-tRNA(Gln) amidotransferase A subunit family amidase